jgi:hypothetical protein
MEWKWVNGYEKLYMVSVDGNVKTFNWKNTGKESILKPATDKKGYLRVGLQKDGKLSTHKVHRIVAIAFLDNSNNLTIVNHKDSNKYNNNVSNLEWVTPKQNTEHAILNKTFKFQTSKNSINKTIKRGELNGGSILDELTVLSIRKEFIPKKVTRKDLALKYGVTESCIKDVVLRKSWKHI